MLEVSGLCVDYGAQRVIHALDLALQADEILTLVGPTGCGKSTILQAVAGLVPIAAGEVKLGTWRATPAHGVPPEARSVGMVFQDFALFPHLTVQQNVSFRLADASEAERWLEMLGIASLRDAKPGRLSGGQKQRVALARTLAHRPALVLLDEPLSNLDAALKDTLRWDIRDALKGAGVPAVWVTHDQNEALSMGDRLGVLQAGRLEQLATPEQCFRSPANRFVARFLGEAGFLPGTLEGERAQTPLGGVECRGIDVLAGAVDVLVRPGDLNLSEADGDANARVTWTRYEGATWLCGVRLDAGPGLQVRVPHAQRFASDARVRVAFASTDALAAFAEEG